MFPRKLLNSIYNMDCPGQCTDLNPIYKLWHKTAIILQKNKPSTKTEQMEGFNKPWF